MANIFKLGAAASVLMSTLARSDKLGRIEKPCNLISVLSKYPHVKTLW